MCQQPRRMPNGVEVACRECWQCRENYINDWVGRCIAESQVATASHLITLTYGPDEHGNEDHVRARILTYSDVQLYLKRLRRAGYPLRYFVVGEYGSRKGRAHWHLLAFWQDKVPPHQLDKRFMEPHWADGKDRVRGWSQWERLTHYAVRYCCKYITKEAAQRGERQGHLAMSKKPPLGDGYLRQLAARYAQQGLAPQDAFYSFPDVCDKKGKRIKFFLRGVSRENFLRYYAAEWRRRSVQHEPSSDFMLDFHDREAERAISLRWLCTRQDYGPPGGAQLRGLPHSGLFFSPIHDMWLCRADDGALWAYGINDEGMFTWRSAAEKETVRRPQNWWVVEPLYLRPLDQWPKKGSGLRSLS